MGDRYFVNPAGYFVELPDGTLSPVTARVAFPLVNCYPAVDIADLELQTGFGAPAYFVYAARQATFTGKPQPMQLNSLRYEAEHILPQAGKLSPPEQYLAIRVLEAGLMSEDKVEALIKLTPPGQTLGQQIIWQSITEWETLVAACLDTRMPSYFDPPASRRTFFLREWELAGEILIAMGKITRTNLEYALAIKREGNKTVGEILTAIGACTAEDVQACLKMQRDRRDSRSDVNFLGDLLVRRGVISKDALERILKHQAVATHSLAEIFVSMNACAPEDIEEFKRFSGGHGFQDQIDDDNLANWLVENNKVTQAQVQQAYGLQGRSKHVLGQIVLSMGLCTVEELEQTLALQREARAESDPSERLGSLLLSEGKINQSHLEKALSLQTRGRRALGQILMAVGGCSRAAVNMAIDLQQKWRDKVAAAEDRLGEVLVRRGFLTPENLEQAMQLHQSSAQPIGRILVDRRWCTPEEIVASLLMRDYKRQCDLLTFIKNYMAQQDADGELTEVLQTSWLKPEN
jgi:hypothetical protein